ncbi:MAG: hypothetical protein E7256_14320 [Lachnospiraceae bacterium]|nr:hypothetical protein [Lachnospiraceae bacterium]
MILEQLHKMITNKEYAEATTYMEENTAAIFANDKLDLIYKEINQEEFLSQASDLVLLITAWCAFFNKDNEMVTKVLKRLEGKNFMSVYDTSSYAALYAVTAENLSQEERVFYATKAMQALPQGDTSAYMVNAKLVYEQITGKDQK